MKLKLESQDGITILTITEGIDPQQVAILKAGLNKIFQSGRKIVVLDCTQLDPAPGTETIGELATIPVWSLQAEAQVLLAGKIPGLGEVSSREEAMQKLSSPLYRMLAQENQLKEKLRRMQEKKAQLEAALGNVAGGRSEILQMRKANSDLRQRVVGLESLVRRHLKSRGQDRDPAELQAVTTRMSALGKTLIAVLEQEGILPVT